MEALVLFFLVWEVHFHPTNPDHLFTCSEDGSLLHWETSSHSDMSSYLQGKSGYSYYSFTWTLRKNMGVHQQSHLMLSIISKPSWLNVGFLYSRYYWWTLFCFSSNIFQVAETTAWYLAVRWPPPVGTSPSSALGSVETPAKPDWRRLICCQAKRCLSTA